MVIQQLEQAGRIPDDAMYESTVVACTKAGQASHAAVMQAQMVRQARRRETVKATEQAAEDKEKEVAARDVAVAEAGATLVAEMDASAILALATAPTGRSNSAFLLDQLRSNLNSPQSNEGSESDQVYGGGGGGGEEGGSRGIDTGFFFGDDGGTAFDETHEPLGEEGWRSNKKEAHDNQQHEQQLLQNDDTGRTQANDEVCGAHLSFAGVLPLPPPPSQPFLDSSAPLPSSGAASGKGAAGFEWRLTRDEAAAAMLVAPAGDWKKSVLANATAHSTFVTQPPLLATSGAAAALPMPFGIAGSLSVGLEPSGAHGDAVKPEKRQPPAAFVPWEGIGSGDQSGRVNDEKSQHFSSSSFDRPLNVNASWSPSILEGDGLVDCPPIPGFGMGVGPITRASEGIGDTAGPGALIDEQAECGAGGLDEYIASLVLGESNINALAKDP
jgi:hypothetical protein